MAIQIPSARGVSDVIRASFTPNDGEPQTVGDLAGYRPTDDNARDTTLSVRDSEFGIVRAGMLADMVNLLDGNRAIALDRLGHFAEMRYDAVVRMAEVAARQHRCRMNRHPISM